MEKKIANTKADMWWSHTSDIKKMQISGQGSGREATRWWLSHTQIEKDDIWAIWCGNDGVVHHDRPKNMPSFT